MVEKFINKTLEALNNPVLRKKILITFLIIIIYRFLSAIPLPGVDVTVFKSIFTNGSPVFTIFSSITGGRFDAPTLATMGLASYISASLLVQLLQPVIPKLEELSKEGERGRMIINQITRYLTVPISIVQAILIYYVFTSLNATGQSIITDTSRSTVVAIVLAITASTMFLMWLSEAITESGIGNGSTVIILVGILTNLPLLIKTDYESLINSSQINLMIGLVLVFIAMFIIIVAISEAVRKIPIKYSSRIRSPEGNMLPTQEGSFFPIKPNMVGVMPVILASSFAIVPSYLSQYIKSSLAGQESRKLYQIADWLQNHIYASNNNAMIAYIAIEVVLIILFSIFYTYIVFKPDEVSDNLKKSGAFIPGVRPGESTSKYLNTTLLKVTTIGMFFLCIIAILPTIVRVTTSSIVQITTFSYVGGTSLIIVVTGILEIFRQINATKNVKSYDDSF